MVEGNIGRRKFLLRAAGTVVGLGLGGVAWTTLIEPGWILVTRRRIRIPGLCPELEGKTIAQLSDLHFGQTSPEYVERCVERTNELRPDLVAITGDHVGRNTGDQAARVARILSRLEAPLGVFAISGNHDHGVYRPSARGRHPQVMDRLEEEGIRNLDNVALPFGAPGARSWLVGLGDVWAGACRIDETMADLPREDARIVLSHNPDTVDPIARAGADLVLSGHTHGGQVDIPVFGPPILPVRNREHYSGLYDVGRRTRLYVSNGLGYLIRVRFNARPEIALHELTSG